MARKPSSWTRRALLTTTGSVGVLAVAGCVSETDPDESEDDPEENDDGSTQPDSNERSAPGAVVEEFFRAYERADVEGMNALVHGDSPMEPIEKEDVDSSDATTFEEVDAKTVEKEDREAIVELLLTVETPERETATRPVFVDVRTEDGEWQVWELGAEYDGENARVPRTSFEFDGTDSGTEIGHADGSPVRADRLYVRGEGIEATGNWADLGGETSGELDGHPAVEEDDVLALETADTYTVRVVWENDEEGIHVTLTSMAASSDSVSDSDPPTDQGVEAYLAETGNFDGEIADETGSEVVTVTAGEIGDGTTTFGFSPPAIRVDPGTTVVWEVETAAHSVTSVDGTFDSGILEEGSSWEYTFEEAGEYLYFCEPHAGIGMRGAVVVGDSG